MVKQMTEAMKSFEDSTGKLYELLKDADPQSVAIFKQLAEVGKAVKGRVAKIVQSQGQGAATPPPASQATNPAEEPPGPVAAAA